ncbi:tRNA-dihydrouridine(16/17) synthase [NAD(P)(+)]-like isoform X2 [Esox lucius]|uniref:tRNA-dihydrouridine(16/17) synthase [NAD(P)(+)]-like isoform X2 n=1 Tax=Esox lucius TaxID=8010 RepID=UPI0009734832|nr:tRNA-dihydrouridine(16/17) synthase [NAD(P)(+)]-like isoform X2 [Esox lucius]
MAATKLQGFEFWRTTLKGARYVVAPMVDQSELAWRLLSRRHGAELCYTPMMHAQVFVRDANYRRDNLYSEVCPEDRPLITQFCANDPEVFVKACLLAQDHCDAIDLNLGCPQMIAKRGHYGVFLQDEWDLLEKMVTLANEKISVPITCKIRVFSEIERTVQYAQMLEKAGCQLLTVHGRTKDQKGPSTGVASWEHIKAVREAVNIPVFANGNIHHLSDVEQCMKETGVQGVMSAEGNLHNPALFEGRSPPVWEMAEEYLEVVHQHPPCTLSYVRAHLFKLWHHTYVTHPPCTLSYVRAHLFKLWHHTYVTHPPCTLSYVRAHLFKLWHHTYVTHPPCTLSYVRAHLFKLWHHTYVTHPPCTLSYVRAHLFKLWHHTYVTHPPCTLSYVRAHLFKLWHHTLQIHQDLREELGKVKNVQGLAEVSRQLKIRCQEEIANGGEKARQGGTLPFPHWICQPYIRPVSKDPVANGNGRLGSEVKTVCHKRSLSQDSDGQIDGLSKNQQKKKARNPYKNFCSEQRQKYIKCEQCGNPKGNKCVFNLCRACCKRKALKEVADCLTHHLMFKTKAEKRKAGVEEGKLDAVPEGRNGTLVNGTATIPTDSQPQTREQGEAQSRSVGGIFPPLGGASTSGRVHMDFHSDVAPLEGAGENPSLLDL